MPSRKLIPDYTAHSQCTYFSISPITLTLTSPEWGGEGAACKCVHLFLGITNLVAKECGCLF